MSKVIKGGTIVTADREWKSDILIDGEIIKQIGNNLTGDLEDRIYYQITSGTLIQRNTSFLLRILLK